MAIPDRRADVVDVLLKHGAFTNSDIYKTIPARRQQCWKRQRLRDVVTWSTSLRALSPTECRRRRRRDSPAPRDGHGVRRTAHTGRLRRERL